MPSPPDPSTSSILFKNPDSTVVVFDIPRSIEETQVLPGQKPNRRLLSSAPLSAPFPIPEPKDAAAARHAQPPSALLADLMTGAAVQQALETLSALYHGPYCLPRVTTRDSPLETGTLQWIPEGSTAIHGTIQEKASSFSSQAPLFDLIVLDPPWPNRSAKRKRGGYQTTTGLTDTRELLSQIPISTHLTTDGLVAIWITNRPSLTDLLTAPGSGLLTYWGLEVAAEWTWLKTTTSGEPVYDVDSTWRKPWERIIIARKLGSSVSVPQQRVIVAVPDLHSRKPALRGLFEDVLPLGYRGLEVFARNLTAGWWSWGNEVFRFQQPECWVEADFPATPDAATDDHE
ncbi:MT-A70 family [Plectosphaerella plurivora]|uniref:MT-A70 family n=1 Tax=Plectosphaerella plurivora TaxID=936078 RepID=A0A9P8V206_9PEZI|nr:MT-A70 family [Plectosphaerella plurivora]